MPNDNLESNELQEEKVVSKKKATTKKKASGPAVVKEEVVVTPKEVTEEVVVTPKEVTEEVVVTPKEEVTEEAVIVVEELAPHLNVSPIVTKASKKKLGIKKAIVANCKALRLREGANVKTRIVETMNADTEVSVNLDNSTESFYEVTYNNGSVELIGFCVKKFIDLV